MSVATVNVTVADKIVAPTDYPRTRVTASATYVVVHDDDLTTVVSKTLVKVTLTRTGPNPDADWDNHTDSIEFLPHDLPALRAALADLPADALLPTA